MLLKIETLKRIKAGEIRVVFRSWVRPTVKTGGRLRTTIGVRGIVEVREIALPDLTEADAMQAGYASLESLLTEIPATAGRVIYRISVNFSGQDDRRTRALDETQSSEERDQILARLGRIDRAAGRDGWSAKVLRLIENAPGVAARDLAARMDEEKLAFKKRVRRLKELGLTESLSVHYQLAPRGKGVHAATG